MGFRFGVVRCTGYPICDFKVSIVCISFSIVPSNS